MKHDIYIYKYIGIVCIRFYSFHIYKSVKNDYLLKINKPKLK